MKTNRERWLIIISCATFLGLIYAARGIFVSVSQGRPVDWPRQVGFEFLYWYVWAAFTPLVIWFARRYPIDRARVRRMIFALIAFGLLIAPLQSLTEFSIAYSIDWLRGIPENELQRRRLILGRVVVVETFGNFIIYSLIVCGHYAYDYYQRYRERVSSRFPTAMVPRSRCISVRVRICSQKRSFPAIIQSSVTL